MEHPRKSSASCLHMDEQLTAERRPEAASRCFHLQTKSSGVITVLGHLLLQGAASFAGCGQGLLSKIKKVSQIPL